MLQKLLHNVPIYAVCIACKSGDEMKCWIFFLYHDVHVLMTNKWGVN